MELSFTHFVFLKIVAFSLLQKETEGQCVEEYPMLRLPKYQPAQSFELAEKVGRSFEKCLLHAQNRLPNVQAIFHSLEGECIGYFEFDFDAMEEDGNVGSRLCVLAPVEKISDEEIANEFGPLCLTALFNGLVHRKLTDKIIFDEKASTMRECLGMGSAHPDANIQAVEWATAGRCIGFYNTQAMGIMDFPDAPMANYLCIMDPDLADAL